MFAQLLALVQNLVQLYLFAMFIWAVGSWFPQLRGSKFYNFLDSIIEPYARLFRGLIPPIGGFDLSIIVAFIALNLIADFLLPLLFSPFLAI